MNHPITRLAAVAGLALVAGLGTAPAEANAPGYVLNVTGTTNPSCQLVQGHPVVPQGVGPVVVVGPVRHAGTVTCAGPITEIRSRVRLHHSPAADCSLASNFSAASTYEFDTIVTVNTLDTPRRNQGGCWRGFLEVRFTFVNPVDATQAASNGCAIDGANNKILHCEIFTGAAPE